MANEINIAELRRLHAATTQGEWRTIADSFDPPEWFVATSAGVFGDCIFGPSEAMPVNHNYEFAVRAHNIWPALLDELERLRAFKIDGMTIGDLNKLRSMLTEATIARTEYERALNASEERVAELLRSNKQLRDALQELHDFSDVLQGGEFVRWNQVRGKAVEALRETE